MTGKLDSRARDTAERMIAAYGKAMTLRRQTEGAYNATTGLAAVTSADYAVVGVLGAPSKTMIDAHAAQSSDMGVLLAAQALTVEPLVGDDLVAEGVTWEIVAVRAIYSGELVAIYEALARS